MSNVDGTVNATLQGAHILPAGAPETYLGVARALLPGVQTLSVAPLTSPIALAMLCAHTLECLLKAYLSRSGDDTRLLKTDVRHQLDKLWILAYSEELAIDADPPYWVQRLAELHANPYHLRYSTRVHAIVLPPLSAMAEGTAALLPVVSNAIDQYRRDGTQHAGANLIG
jgi:hypothetical protein